MVFLIKFKDNEERASELIFVSDRVGAVCLLVGGQDRSLRKSATRTGVLLNAKLKSALADFHSIQVKLGAIQMHIWSPTKRARQLC